MTHCQMLHHFLPILSTRIIRCEDIRHQLPRTTELYGISVPESIQVGSAPFTRKHVNIGSSARCMHDMCWFPPARAYVITTMVNESALNRAVVDARPANVGSVCSGEGGHNKHTSPSPCPSLNHSTRTILSSGTEKTFLITFLASKDDKHIQRGFENSLKSAGADQDVVKTFVEFIQGKVLNKGDTLQVTCLPSEEVAFLTLRQASGEQYTVGIRRASSLIKALHKLYLIDEATEAADWSKSARYVSIARSIAEQANRVVVVP